MTESKKQNDEAKSIIQKPFKVPVEYIGYHNQPCGRYGMYQLDNTFYKQGVTY